MAVRRGPRSSELTNGNHSAVTDPRIQRGGAVSVRLRAVGAARANAATEAIAGSAAAKPGGIGACGCGSATGHAGADEPASGCALYLVRICRLWRRGGRGQRAVLVRFRAQAAGCG